MLSCLFIPFTWIVVFFFLGQYPPSTGYLAVIVVYAFFCLFFVTWVVGESTLSGSLLSCYGDTYN